MAGQIWPTGHGLPTPILEHRRKGTVLMELRKQTWKIGGGIIRS